MENPKIPLAKGDEKKKKRKRKKNSPKNQTLPQTRCKKKHLLKQKLWMI